MVSAKRWKLRGARSSESHNKPTAPSTVRTHLRSVMPYIGMRCQSEERLMHDVRRDKRVADALEVAIQNKLCRSASHAFFLMFRAADPIVGKAHAQGFDLWDILPSVQRNTYWARELPEAIFFELFTCLVEARHEWLKNAKPSRRPTEDSSLVRGIDTFRRNVGDCPKGAKGYNREDMSWILVDAVFFNELARGFHIDEDEDEDIEMQDIHDGGRAKRDEDVSDTDTDIDAAVARVTPRMEQMEIKQKTRTTS
ncbi:hypothetical protein EKO27_g2399 [Xylaria grammica]|uniref:Uncharacterized protein n=1 Tax=Xylaria grammica TaxID=363999 RepID=A0A439DEB6_9PEZI|nr:hypothetical protein EKO27_g2399 [Xylaria grammica]